MREYWTKPSFSHQILRRVENLYKMYKENADFLLKHPLPNSFVVDVTQNRAQNQLASNNKEARKLDVIGRHMYSLALFVLRVAS